MDFEVELCDLDLEVDQRKKVEPDDLDIKIEADDINLPAEDMVRIKGFSNGNAKDKMLRNYAWEIKHAYFVP